MAQGSEFRGPGFAFGVWGLGFGVSGFGLRVSGFEFGVWGLRFRVSGSGLGLRFEACGGAEGARVLAECERHWRWPAHGYLVHKKQPLHRTLP